METKTIILQKPLPREKSTRVLHMVDGIGWREKYIRDLLIKDGHTINIDRRECMQKATEWEGIKIGSKDYGNIIWPKDPKDYEKLMDAMVKTGHWFRPCAYP